MQIVLKKVFIGIIAIISKHNENVMIYDGRLVDMALAEGELLSSSDQT